MATRVHTRLVRAFEDRELGTIVNDYMRDATAGRAGDAAGVPYTAAGLRSLERTLVHIGAHATLADLTAAGALGAAARERLARRIVDDADLPPGRHESIAAALAGLIDYTVGDSWIDPPPRRPGRRVRTAEAAATAAVSRTPTHAMLALGAQVSAWMQRVVVIAFVLTAIGLALELR